MRKSFVILWLPIQPPYTEIEISREDYPQSVRNLQVCGGGINFEIAEYSFYDESEEQQKYYKGYHKRSQIKKYDIPQKIYSEAYAVHRQCRFFL